MRKGLFSFFAMFLLVFSLLAMLVSDSKSADLHDVAVIDIVISPGLSAFSSYEHQP